MGRLRIFTKLLFPQIENLPPHSVFDVGVFAYLNVRRSVFIFFTFSFFGNTQRFQYNPHGAKFGEPELKKIQAYKCGEK